MTVYGIPNCDTVKKTINFLRKHHIDFEFHDYKKSGISKAKLNEWCKKTGWEVLLNKKSTTWRELPYDKQQSAIDEPSAVKIMTENNSIIKRPVIETAEKLIVGFNEQDLFKQLKIK